MKSRTLLAVTALAVFLALIASGCGGKRAAPKARSGPAKTASAKQTRPNATRPAEPKTTAKTPEKPVDLSQLFGQAQQPPQPVSPLAGALSSPAPPSGPSAAPPRKPGAASGAQAAAPVVPDRPTAQQLLKVLQSLYSRAQSLKVDYKTSQTMKQDGKVVRSVRDTPASMAFRRPDKFAITTDDIQLRSDGKTFYSYASKQKRYLKTAMSKDIMRGVVLGSPGVGVLGLLLGVDYTPAISSMKLLPDAKVGGRDAYVLSLNLKAPTGVASTQKLWIDKRDMAIYRNQIITEVRPKAPKGAQGKVPKVIWSDTSLTVTKITANEKLPDSLFVFKPPSGARQVEPPKKIDLTGKAAPDFEFKWTDGTQKKLSDFRGKPVVLYFWAMPQSAEHLSVIQKLYDQDKDKAQILGVNLNAEVAKVDEYLRKKGFSFPTIHPSLEMAQRAAMQYGLMAVPTVVIIDDKGTVLGGLPGTPTLKAIEDKLSKAAS